MREQFLLSLSFPKHLLEKYPKQKKENGCNGQLTSLLVTLYDRNIMKATHVVIASTLRLRDVKYMHDDKSSYYYAYRGASVLYWATAREVHSRPTR